MARSLTDCGGRVRILSFVDHAPPTRDITSALEQAAKWGVDVIVSQGTGTDFGPHWLGSGRQFPLANFQDNIRPYLHFARDLDIPFVMSVGIAGADVHLRAAVEAFNDVCTEEHLRMRVATVSGEVAPDYLARRLEAGTRMPRLDDHDALRPELSLDDVRRSVAIVAQMGPEPIVAALRDGVDGVITGRALDTGLFMAPVLAAGGSRAAAAHVGKLLEIGGSALVGGDAGMPVYGVVDGDEIEIRSPHDDARCSIETVAALSFYEREDPLRERNPGGVLDMSAVEYEQVDSQRVRVRGATWTPAPYTVKLEGAHVQGYRCINVSGIREPRYLAALDDVIARIRGELAVHPRLGPQAGDYTLTFTVYGRDAVLGPAEPMRGVEHEVGVVVDVVASTAELARDVCYVCYIGLWHKPYPGRQTTAGNSAQRFSPPMIDAGPVYGWSAWHLLPLDDPCEPFARRDYDFPVEEVTW